MKHGVIAAFLLFTALLLSSCSVTQGGRPSGDSPVSEMSSGTENEDAYQQVTAEEAKRMIDRGGVTIVDVRTAEEYEQAHLPGAILVPNESIKAEMPAALPDKKAELIVYCRTGIRSRQAADKLVELGYKHVYDMGGIVNWNYETESGAAK